MKRWSTFLLVAALSGAVAGLAVELAAAGVGSGVNLVELAGVQQTDYQTLGKEIYAELISLRSTADMPQNVKAAAVAMQRRLIDAGFPEEDVQVVSPYPELGSMVARFRGQAPGGGPPTKEPVMLMAHIDVVDALRSDWEFDPFELREIEGYFYGRGTDDNKAGATHIVVNLIRLKQEGYVPDRDLIAVMRPPNPINLDCLLLARPRYDCWD